MKIEYSQFTNGKAAKTTIRNWYLSCDDARYKSPEYFDLRSSLLTLDNAQTSSAVFSFNRSLEEQEDYYQFLAPLDLMSQSYEPDGTPLGRNYILYAYCLMSNRRQTERKRARSICRGAKEVECYSIIFICSFVNVRIRLVWQ